jgi:hypothetical protein
MNVCPSFHYLYYIPIQIYKVLHTHTYNCTVLKHKHTCSIYVLNIYMCNEQTYIYILYTYYTYVLYKIFLYKHSYSECSNPTLPTFVYGNSVLIRHPLKQQKHWGGGITWHHNAHTHSHVRRYTNAYWTTIASILCYIDFL